MPVRERAGTLCGMETDDDLFLGMIEGVTLTVLDRIGDDPEARYQFFRLFVELAREVAPEPIQ